MQRPEFIITYEHWDDAWYESWETFTDYEAANIHFKSLQRRVADDTVRELRWSVVIAVDHTDE